MYVLLDKLMCDGGWKINVTKEKHNKSFQSPHCEIRSRRILLWQERGWMWNHRQSPDFECNREKIYAPTAIIWNRRKCRKSISLKRLAIFTNYGKWHETEEKKNYTKTTSTSCIGTKCLLLLLAWCLCTVVRVKIVWKKPRKSNKGFSSVVSSYSLIQKGRNCDEENRQSFVDVAFVNACSSCCEQVNNYLFWASNVKWSNSDRQVNRSFCALFASIRKMFLMHCRLRKVSSSIMFPNRAYRQHSKTFETNWTTMFYYYIF